MKYKTTLYFLVLGISFAGIAQVPETTSYHAGYTSFQLVDSSRTYKPGAQKGDPLHYRPLDFDIWYPTFEKTERPLLFKDLFGLQEERAYYYEEKDYTGYTEEMAAFLAVGFGLQLKDGQKLLNTKTSSFPNARVAKGNFPLVLYMAGYNGMGWENYRLLEKMAENGFVVLAVSSIGKYPGNMSNSLSDTMEQVYDGEFALETIVEESYFNIDTENIGVIGLSWGGMSAALLLDIHPEIKAMVSLDGTDVFYFGDTDQDDVFLSEIYEADVLHPKKTRAAYMYIESGNKLEEFTPIGEYHYFKKINSPKNYLRFKNSEHEDFGSIAWALEVSAERTTIYSEITRSTLLFFRQYLLDKEGFSTYRQELIKNTNIVDQPYAYSSRIPKELLLSGSVNDATTKNPLSYVNIGVLNKDWGTVSNKNGVFELQLNETHIRDTLRISMVGYKPLTILVKNLMNRKERFQINLEEDISNLKEVVVTAKKWNYKTIGNKTKSKFLGTGFSYDMLGAELGVRINLPKKPVLARAFNFHVSYNRLGAKAIFRLNMYRVKGGKPADNIIKESILIPVEAGQTGIISTDLKKYDIVLQEDVIVMLEWVEADGEIKTGEGIFLSLGMFTGGTYHRKSSQGKLKKLKGLGVGYNLDVKY